MNILNEITRKNLVGKSKKQSPDRYNRRLGYTPKSYKGIDTSRLFNDDIIIIQVPVGDYICTVAFKGMLEHLKAVVDKQPTPKVTLQSVIRAMNIAIDDTDLLVDCTCPDFCLHEDTQIKLLNGEIYSIKDIKSKFDNNEELWVYSVDENGDFKPGKVTDVWISGYTNQMIKITLDNGKEIITTPNHRYMLRNGSYEEAQNLSVGQSLMPLYFNYHNGYESVKINSENNIWRSVYKLVSGELLDDESKERRFRNLRKIAIIGASKPKSKHMKQSISESMKQRYSQMTKDKRKHYTEHLNNPETQRKSKIGRYRYALDYIVNNGLSLNSENYYKYKRKSDPKIETYFNSFDELIEYFGLQYYNHRISSIELINYENPIPVYDLTVDKWNNFYVDAGVILHNCYRFAYWATKYGYKYGKPETRPSKITNPNDKLGAMCKHLDALLGNKKWVTKVASTFNSFIKENEDKVRKALGVSEDEFKIAKPSKIPKGSKFNKQTKKYELPKKDDEVKNSEADTFSNEPDKDDEESKFKNKPVSDRNDFKQRVEDQDDSDEELELNDEESEE